jgi:hypothetical protein
LSAKTSANFNPRPLLAPVINTFRLFYIIIKFNTKN